MGTPRPVSSVRRFAAAVLCLAFVALGVLAPLHALHHHPKAQAEPACACQHAHAAPATHATSLPAPPSAPHAPDDHEAACGLCQFLAGCAAPSLPVQAARTFTLTIPFHGSPSSFLPPTPTFLPAGERGPPRT